MKVKLDENLGNRGAEILREGGCEVVTVVEEDLCSAADSTLIEVSRAEGRVLISLDKDFTNTVRVLTLEGHGYGARVLLDAGRRVGGWIRSREPVVASRTAVGPDNPKDIPSIGLWQIIGNLVCRSGQPPGGCGALRGCRYRCPP